MYMGGQSGCGLLVDPVTTIGPDHGVPVSLSVPLDLITNVPVLLPRVYWREESGAIYSI